MTRQDLAQKLKHPLSVVAIVIVFALAAVDIHNKFYPSARVAAPVPGPEDIIGRAMADVAAFASQPVYELSNALVKKAHELAQQLDATNKRLDTTNGRVDATNKRIDGAEQEIKGIKERQLEQGKIVDAAKKRFEEKPLPKLAPISELKSQLDRLQKEASDKAPNFTLRPTA